MLLEDVLQIHLLIRAVVAAQHVAQAVAKSRPVPMEFVAIQDTYAESGTPDQLMEKYGLTAPYIVKAVRSVLKRKS